MQKKSDSELREIRETGRDYQTCADEELQNRRYARKMLPDRRRARRAFIVSILALIVSLVAFFKAELQLSDIQRRVLWRLANEESKKQKNIEDVIRIRRALPELKQDAQTDKLHDDWLVYFFDRCRLVSDQEMQGLWSGVLPGEANSRGAFSKRTLNLLFDLEKADAEIFTRLCGFVWVIGRSYEPLIYDAHDEIYKQQGLTFGLLKHFAAIRLIGTSV